jgi:transglutaminase/protease-like cytokinesis protein 3
MHPLGAYALDSITYNIGTGGGQPAISVNISYIHGRSEIRKIRNVADTTAAAEQISRVLDQCSEGVVMLVENYTPVDLVQLVEDYVQQNPDTVMEQPQVAVGIYPDFGERRVVELKFAYQTSRESLRTMQSQVQRVFSSAELYLPSDSEDSQKYALLYSFLMERSDYQFETSITPAYSLLIHGVGDGDAFASVYAAMCRNAGITCEVISGTCNGEPRIWNLIQSGETYRHVDLLSCYTMGRFQSFSDEEMTGYVWDYSAYSTP